MAIERLDEEVRLPFDEEALASGDPKRLLQYMFDLVRQLRELLESNAVVTNLGINVSDGEAIYFQNKNADGTYPIGTWRLIQIGDNLVRQVQLTLNVWTKAGIFNRPKT